MLRVSMRSAERLWEMSCLWLENEGLTEDAVTQRIPGDAFQAALLRNACSESALRYVHVNRSGTLGNLSRQRRWFNWDAHQVTPEFHIWFINLCCCCFLFFGRGRGELWFLRGKHDSDGFSMYPVKSATRRPRVWIWITSLVWTVEHFP